MYSSLLSLQSYSFGVIQRQALPALVPSRAATNGGVAVVEDFARVGDPVATLRRVSRAVMLRALLRLSFRDSVRASFRVSRRGAVGVVGVAVSWD